MAAEFDFLDWVRRQGRPDGRVAVGVGDDLAVLRWAADDLLLVGVDQVLDGVHFTSADHGPAAVGRKAMNRNLSDCAAMGCLPAAAVVTLALPRGVGGDYAKQLFLGLTAAGEPFDCPVVGGDTGSWAGPLAVTVTILGRSAGVDPVTRTGARPGDGVYVTGPLGGSLLGRHLAFTPRVALGRFLARTRQASAMIDLSDGLSRDLTHLCRGVGAVVEAARVPVHPDVARLPPGDRSPLEHALDDGEDYELLFTAPEPPRAYACDDGPLARQCHRVGTVVAEPGVWLASPDGTRRPLAARSWEHAL